MSGTIEGIVTDRALVCLADGGMAWLAPELVAEGVAAGRMFAKRQPVSGVLETTSGRLVVDALRVTPADAVAAYSAGDVVLGLVRNVERSEAIVELFPDFQVAVAATDIAASGYEDLRNLLTEGEVVAAKIVETGPSDDMWQVSLIDVESDDVPRTAPAVLRGGPPWLSPDEVDKAEPEPSPPEEPERSAAAPSAPVIVAAAPIGDSPALGSEQSEAFVALRGEVAGLRAAVESLREQNETLRIELNEHYSARVKAERLVNTLEAEKRRAVQERRKLEHRLKNVANDSESPRAAFADEEEQLRYDAYVSWATRTSAHDKVTYPWPDLWRIGPAFLPSVRQLAGVSRDRIVDVVCDLVVGRDRQLDVHKLRESEAASASQRTRSDGAVAFRASLQTNTASARRIHYWRLPDGTLEFAKVGVHDDLSI